MILFVSHDAKRAGAPMALLHLLRWIRRNTRLEFEVLLMGDGDLRPEFESLGAVHEGYRKDWRSLLDRAVRKARRSLPGAAGRPEPRDGATFASAALRRRLRPERFRMIYANTITNGRIVAQLARPGQPVITHVHEMDSWIDLAGPDNWRQVVDHTTRFIAVADAVRRAVVARGVPDARVTVIPECAQPPAADAARSRRLLVERLGIDPASLIVCGGGLEVWRKGRDLFVQLAAACRRTIDLPETHFIWIGAAADPETARCLELDARRSGCLDRVHWLGHVTNPQDYLAAADVFAMTSREDPMPLVAIEAGMLGVPVVCFTEAGGTSEWVGDECGRCVPILDVAAMAAAIRELALDPGLRGRLGRQAAARTAEIHSIDRVAAAIVGVIESTLAGAAA